LSELSEALERRLRRVGAAERREEEAALVRRLRATERELEEVRHRVPFWDRLLPTTHGLLERWELRLEAGGWDWDAPDPAAALSRRPPRRRGASALSPPQGVGEQVVLRVAAPAGGDRPRRPPAEEAELSGGRLGVSEARSSYCGSCFGASTVSP